MSIYITETEIVHYGSETLLVLKLSRFSTVTPLFIYANLLCLKYVIFFRLEQLKGDMSC